MAKNSSAPRPLEDLRVESVDRDGNIVVRLPGGAALRLHSSPELARYYQRLSVHPEGEGGGQ